MLLHLDEAAIAAQTRPVFIGNSPTNEVPVAGAVATIMDVALPPGSIPDRLRRRISYTLPDSFLAPIIGSRTVEGPDLAVDRRVPIVLAPPLRGACFEPPRHPIPSPANRPAYAVQFNPV